MDIFKIYDTKERVGPTLPPLEKKRANAVPPGFLADG